ncbi:MAG: guanylate kinase [Candidatus Riflebacteria bacterium]|nr:guanylate kinase [Candidatus Riflebacteria bacterium]
MPSEILENRGKLFVISGPSGVGKTVLCNYLLQRFFPGVIYSISTTSRQPRGNEAEGQEYNFCTKEEFEKAIQEDSFVEWACVHGNYYGTPYKFLEDTLNAGKNLLLNIDVQGAIKIKNKFPDAVMIFILPPSMSELEQRLRIRNADTEDSLKRRMANAEEELKYTAVYNYTIVNDNLEKAQKELAEIYLLHTGKS